MFPGICLIALPMRSPIYLLFRWHVLRHARRHWVLAGLNVLAVGLGVAVFVAIQVANGSAARAFEAGVDLVAGKAQLEVRGKLDDSIFPAIQHTAGRACGDAGDRGAGDAAGLSRGVFAGARDRRVYAMSRSGHSRSAGQGGGFDLERWLATPRRDRAER